MFIKALFLLENKYNIDILVYCDLNMNIGAGGQYLKKIYGLTKMDLT